MKHIQPSYTLECTYANSLGNCIYKSFPIDSLNPKLSSERYLEIVFGSEDDYLLVMINIVGNQIRKAENGTVVSELSHFEPICLSGDALYSRLCA